MNIYKHLSELKTNRTSFLCGNRNGHHNTERKTHNRTTQKLKRWVKSGFIGPQILNFDRSLCLSPRPKAVLFYLAKFLLEALLISITSSIRSFLDGMSTILWRFMSFPKFRSSTDVDIGPVFQGRHSYLTSLCALESPSVMIEEFDCWFIRFNNYL